MPDQPDAALAKFLGIAGDVRWPEVVASLTPERRATYERMHHVTIQLGLWHAGLGPKPAGVLVTKRIRHA